MSLRRTVPLLAAVTAALVAGASASAAPGTAAVVIEHALHGCHAWSVNGNPLRATQSVTLRRGAKLTVTDNDVMSHTLILTSGPKLSIAHPTLSHIGASLTVTFSKAGTYVFRTRAGEDYKSAGDVKTIGEDNVLRLTVVVH